MGLFDKLKRKPADTHLHPTTSIPERVDNGGKTYIQQYYHYGIDLDHHTDYEYLIDGDEISFKEEGGEVHAYFDDSVDVGIVRDKNIIKRIYDFAGRGDPYISNYCPSSKTIRIGFYKELDRAALKPAKMSVTFKSEDFFAEVGDTVNCEFDYLEARYAIEDAEDTILLSEAKSEKIEEYINKGYEIAEAVVVEKELEDDLKYTIKVEIRFK